MCIVLAWHQPPIHLICPKVWEHILKRVLLVGELGVGHLPQALNIDNGHDSRLR